MSRCFRRISALIVSASVWMLLIFLPTSSQASIINFAPEPSPDSIYISFASLPSALVLVGINPSTIQRPSTPAELKVCIGLGEGDSTGFPTELAVEIAPYWLLKGHEISYEKYADSTLKPTFLQTFAVSAATSLKPNTIVPDSSSMSLALGTSFSVLRGHVDKKTDGFALRLAALKQSLTTLNTKQGNYEAEFRSECEEYKIWKKRRDEADTGSSEWKEADLKLAELEDQFSEQAKERIEKEEAGLLQKIDSLSSSLKLRRTGFKWDWAAAGAVVSPYGGWNDLQWNAGIWTTFGPEWRSFGLIGVGRGLLDSSDPSQLGLDVGVKAFLDKPEFPLIFSGELLHHRVLNADDNQENRLRALLNLEYTLKNIGTLLVTLGKELGPDTGETIVSFKILLGDGTEIPLPIPKNK